MFNKLLEPFEDSRFNPNNRDWQREIDAWQGSGKKIVSQTIDITSATEAAGEITRGGEAKVMMVVIIIVVYEE